MIRMLLSGLLKTQQELNCKFTNKHWILEDNLSLTTSTFHGCTTGGSVDSNRGGGGDSHGGGEDTYKNEG